MNIHEYQAKGLLADYGVPVPSGYAATTAEEVDSAIAKIEGDLIVVKAQIHAGGRGKGTFTDGYKGGVKVVKGRAAAKEAANHMLDNTLVTAQTGPEGPKVQTLYVTEGCDIEHEYYLAIVLDRETAQSVIIASTEGGMDIEEVAEKTPEKLIRVPISPTLGLRHHQCRQVAYALGFEGDQVKQFARIITGVYKMFWEK
ncbi:MAG TPA: succinate--CoA ligase subunit beta, partial [Opitutae bacterium]|nr:succinate--CoA ligase subunit beta [Opitutae bacterium]